MNEIVAQSKNCQLELTLRLSPKVRQLHPTIPAQLLVKTYSARCHYWRMLLFLSSVVVLAQNDNYWVEPLLHSVSDICEIIYTLYYDITTSKMASMRLITFPTWTPTIQIALRAFPKYSQANSTTATQSKTPPRHSTSFPVQYSLSVLPTDGTRSVMLKTLLNIPSNNISKHHNPIIYSSENSKSQRRK